MTCCNQSCDQGRDCPMRAAKVAKIGKQQRREDDQPFTAEEHYSMMVSESRPMTGMWFEFFEFLGYGCAAILCVALCGILNCKKDCGCIPIDVARVGKSYVSPLIQTNSSKQVDTELPAPTRPFESSERPGVIVVGAVTVIVFAICVLAWIGAGALHTHFTR